MYRQELLEKIAILDNNPSEYIKTLVSKVDFNGPLDSVNRAHDLFLLGRGYLLTGKHDVAVNLLTKALDFFVNNGDKMSLFQCYSNLGIVYREQKQYDLALKMLNKSYNVAYDLDDFSYIILALVNLASVYSSLENIHKALEILDKALEYKDRLKNTKILGDLYNNYAFVLLGENKTAEALEYLFKAYDVYKSIYGDQIQTGMLIVLSNIGETYVLLEDYDNAEQYINKALKFAEENQIGFIEIDCHRNLATMYEAQGDYKMALYHHKRYTMISEESAKAQVDEEIETLKQHLMESSKKSEEEINLLRNVELKNKTDELEKTLKNLANISEIGQKLTSSMDMNQIYEILRSSIYALMHVDVFGLALYDESELKIIYKYFEEGGVVLPLKEIDLNDRNSLASYCIISETDLFIKSFDEEYHQYLPGLTYLSIGDNKAKTTKCIVYCRLIIEGKCIGLITMQSYEPFEYSEADFEVIRALASYVAIATSNAQKKNIISEKAKELEFLSYHDPMTRLYNRRYFNRMTEWYVHEQRALPLGLIIGDMNGLKQINDRFGHLLGDKYLDAIGKIMKRHSKNHPVFRLGGDEFAILVKNATEELLIKIIEQIKQSCEKTMIGPLPLSIALGYEILVDVSTNIDEVFSIAESKMYEEKNVYKNVK